VARFNLRWKLSTVQSAAPFFQAKGEPYTLIRQIYVHEVARGLFQSVQN
jgi:hypothetical protein